MFDGTTVEGIFDHSFFAHGSTIIRTRHDISANRLVMETIRGDTVEVELPTLRAPAPRRDRPIIYLDQRDWSLLASVLFEPIRIRTASQQEAAQYLIALARAQKIILPMSFAHLGETSNWSLTDRRYNLALTLTQLSRGWQMRDPMDVWQRELHHTFASRFKQITRPPLDVFTLEGCAIQSRKTLVDVSSSWSEFPEGIKHVLRAAVCMMSYIDMVLASDSTPETPIPKWENAFQRITDELARSLETSPQKRNILRYVLLSDIKLEVAEAAHLSGITVPELETWIESHFNTDVRAMKSLGLWNEVFQDKHLNTTTKWSANDLTDMMYLTCAAGYADYVLAERSLTSYVKQAARRLHRSIKVYSRIEDLVVELKGEEL